MSIIDTIKYIILGLIQGFTEPIPISSSGHLVIIKNIFNSNILDDMNYEIIVNFGSFLAILFLFRKEIANIIKDFFSYLKTKKVKYKSNFNYLILIIIGTIPAGIIGFFIKDYVDKFSSNTKLIGISLIITGITLFIIKDIKGRKKEKEITIKDSIIIGLFQVISLFPGISRSGATISGGLLQDLERDTAVRYSFMLYLPISLAVMLLGVFDLIKTPNVSSLIIPYFLGTIASFIATYFTMKWFISIIKKGKLIYFSIYCLIVGSLVIILL